MWINPAWTILTEPGGNSSSGATWTSADTCGLVLELELVRERRPLLRERRALGAVERDLEDAEPQDRALHAHGRERDADLVEQLLLGQRRALARLPSLHHLGEHRGRRLRD